MFLHPPLCQITSQNHRFLVIFTENHEKMALFEGPGQKYALWAGNLAILARNTRNFSKNGQNTSCFWRVLDPFPLIRGCTILRSIFRTVRSTTNTGLEESRNYHLYFYPSHTGPGSKLVAWMGICDTKIQSSLEMCHPGVAKTPFFSDFS